MSTGMPNDEVIEAIARIDRHRQEMQKETGPAAAGNEALRRLHELLERERQALQLHGPGGAHAANIEAVAAEIAEVKKPAGAKARPADRNYPQGQPKKRTVHSGAPHNPPHNKGRRTMGRRGDR